MVNSILDTIGKPRNSCHLVIGGDFNLSVSERHPSEEQKNKKCNLEIQSRLRDEWGLINCWQTMHPNTPLAQTLRWTTNPIQPYHCDGIFVPAAWSAQLTLCELLSGSEWDAMSDHNPVLTEFA